MLKTIIIIVAATALCSFIGIGAGIHWIRENTPFQSTEGNLDAFCAPIDDGHYNCKIYFHTPCSFKSLETGILETICDKNPLDVMERP